MKTVSSGEERNRRPLRSLELLWAGLPQQRRLELQSQQEALAIGCATQDFGVEQRDRAWQLRLVDQRDWYFKLDVGAGIKVTADR